MRPEVEVETWAVLEFQAPFASVGAATDNDEWSHEADDLKVVPQFVGSPHLTVVRFECRSASRIAVDLGDSLSSGGFGRISHVRLLRIGIEVHAPVPPSAFRRC